MTAVSRRVGIGSGMETAQTAAGSVVAPFAQVLVEVAEKRADVVGLSADLAKYTDMLPFAQRFPDRFLNLGMAEQNLLGVAAGLAAEGFTPVATTYGVFATRRALDFFVIQAALMRRDVKLVAGLPGLTTGYGATHQAIEDLAIMRAIPDIVVLDPGDATEVAEATRAMLEHHGPVYMRLLRGAVPVAVPAEAPPFRLGRARLLRDGTDVGIIAAGVMMPRALEAAALLDARGVSAAVLSCPTIKPFDREAVAAFASRLPRIVTAENHTVVGGLYSAVAESLAANGVPTVVRPVGIPDTFGGYGSLPYLAERHRMTSSDLVDVCLQETGLRPTTAHSPKEH